MTFAARSANWGDADKASIRCSCANVRFLSGSFLLDDGERDKAPITRDKIIVFKPKALGLCNIEWVQKAGQRVVFQHSGAWRSVPRSR